MKRGRRAIAWLAAAAALAASLAYLRDPPWVGGITSGLRPWTTDRGGTPFRWTNGHASFYVPSGAASLIVPVRAGVPRPDGRRVTVSIGVDGRWLATTTLDAPDRWVQVLVAMPGPSSRRFRRVEVRVDPVIPDRNLGVQVGSVELKPPGGAR